MARDDPGSPEAPSIPAPASRFGPASSSSPSPAADEKMARIEIPPPLAVPRPPLPPWLEEAGSNYDEFFSTMGDGASTALLLDAKALWTVSIALHGVAMEPSPRATRALAALRSFSDPGLLSPIAELLLGRSTEADAREAAQKLIHAAGVAGAYACYGARVRLAADLGVRAPFVLAMQALGAQSWPVVRAALERIPETALTGAHPVAADLAEDIAGMLV